MLSVPQGIEGYATLILVGDSIRLRQPDPDALIRVVALPVGGGVKAAGNFLKLFGKERKTGFGKYERLAIAVDHFG